MKMGVFVLILIVVVAAVVIFAQKAEKSAECQIDSDCVPSACCHSDSCVAKEKAPMCRSIMCSLECVEKTMDCQQGSCACQNNKCIARIA